jgi:hypothetical protein
MLPSKILSVLHSSSTLSTVIGARPGIRVRSGNRGSPGIGVRSGNRGSPGNRGSLPEVTQRRVLMPTTGTDADDGD